MEEQAMVTGEGRTDHARRGAVSVGNVTSRVLGLARDIVKSYYFGANGTVSAFDVAAQVPTMLYDLLTGGMLKPSLVPVFSDYAPPPRRDGKHGGCSALAARSWRSA